MLEKVRNYMDLNYMIEMGDRIVMGISGGADSVALLLLLDRIKAQFGGIELFAVHVNHGIRQEAEEDADYVRRLCEKYRIPFYLFEENIPALAKKRGKTEEEMGREYRYQCFYKIMKEVNAGKLAVAHHMDDQAETMLFHLVRGCNLSGMAGMRPVNDLLVKLEEESVHIIKGRVIRPLLQCRKRELTDWLAQQNMTWREDSTNREDVYSRNRIRNQVLPVLETVNQQAVLHMAEFAECIAEYELFFQQAVSGYIRKEVMPVIKEKGSCQTDRYHLKSQEEVLAKAVIYEMMVSVCGLQKDITKEHVRAVYSLLDKQSGKKVILPYEMAAEISYEKLIIRKCFLEEEDFSSWKEELVLKRLSDGRKEYIRLPEGGCLIIEMNSLENMTEKEKNKFLKGVRNSKNHYTKFFDYDTIKDTLYVRTPEMEDYLVIDTGGNKKKLSRYFIDQKLPLAKRQHQIVVADGHEILWVVGGRRCENHRVSEDTKQILMLMYEGENNEISYSRDDFRRESQYQDL